MVQFTSTLLVLTVFPYGEYFRSIHIMWTLPLAERAAVEGGTTTRMSKYVNSSGDNSHRTRQAYNLRLVRACAL